MSHFIQLHILTPYAASNLNRDDTGRPKTVRFGGAERLRISSQSLKRAFRTSDVFTSLLPDSIGTRSIGFMNGLIDELKKRGLDEAEAIKRAESVVENDRLGKLKKDKPGKTEQLVHLGPDELAEIDQLAERLSGPAMPDLKGVTVLKNKPRAVDIAMFGRMLADNSGYNVEAAIQVAHAFTTHRATVEDDFYTAVDDLKNADSAEDRGAGFLNVQEFGAGLFYLYICINASHLLDNLAGDRPLAQTALEALIKAAATVSPTGKQNAFASRSRAHYILQEIGEEMPRSLAAAFMKPVGSEQENDYYTASVRRLDKLREQFGAIYGDLPEKLIVDMNADSPVPLSEVIAAAQAVIDKA